jgi:cyclopropane fatty-acyl-phospholipid synthase-like methyltransferase
LQEALVRYDALSRMKRSVSLLLMNQDDLYGAEYYESIDRDALSSAGPIATSILRDFAPKTLLDVGCGTGAILATLAAGGVDVTGLEYSKVALNYCRRRGLNVLKYDLESPNSLSIWSRFDLVISMEVAEHLRQDVADRFVDALTSYGDVIVFTAATPGQGGRDHVNEQPHEYWIEKFSNREFHYALDRSLVWRKEWEDQGVASWYFRNLMLFTKTTVGPGAAPGS